MKVVIFENNGSACVLVPQADCWTDGKGKFVSRHLETATGNKLENFRPATIEEIAAKDVPAGVPYEIIDAENLPDRHFRNAWKIESGSVKIDMTKARAAQMDYIRAARNERLTELDKRKYGGEYDAERARLRDLPQNFDLSQANTPDELKALWPEDLS